MAENPDDSAGDNEMARADAANRDGSEAVSSNLPMVVAPRLGTGEDEIIDQTIIDETVADEPAAEAAKPAGHAPQSHSRFLMLAASVAFAAAFGSFVGSVSGSGLARYLDPPSPPGTVEPTTDAMREMKLQLSAIKTDFDTVSRSATSQFAKLSDRLDHITSASETTGSIATAAPAAPVPPKLTDRILQDWIVQDVRGGRALVESRNGGMFDVGEGSTLPGVGRVDSIKRQDGQWLVLTERGTITSGR
jgi:hypothetical protein